MLPPTTDVDHQPNASAPSSGTRRSPASLRQPCRRPRAIRYRTGRDPVAFNCFVNVLIDAAAGALTVEPPLSRAGVSTVFEAAMDLVHGLTACSAPQSNNASFKPIHFQID